MVEPVPGIQWDYIPGRGERRAGAEGRGAVTAVVSCDCLAVLWHFILGDHRGVITIVLCWLCYGSFGTSQQLIFFVISR